MHRHIYHNQITQIGNNIHKYIFCNFTLQVAASNNTHYSNKGRLVQQYISVVWLACQLVGYRKAKITEPRFT